MRKASLPWATPLLFVLTAFMVFGWPVARDNDLYLHLLEGRNFIQTAQWERVDRYSYTAAGQTNECLHSWLSQVVLWLSYRYGGEPGLRWLGFVLLSCSLYSLLRFIWSRTRSNGLTLMAGTLFLLIQSYHFSFRPFLFGQALFSWITLRLLGERPLSKRRAALLAVSAVAWSNLHGSVVLLVPCLAAYTFALAWRHPWHWLSLTSPLWAGALTFLNPMGPALYRLFYDVYRIGNAIVGNPEWKSPFAVLFSSPFRLEFLPTLVAATTVACAVLYVQALRRKKIRCLYEALQSALCIALSTLSARHAPYLLFPLARCGASAVARNYVRHGPLARSREIATTAVALVLLALGDFYRSPEVLASAKRVADFIESSGLSGNLYNPPGWGAYLAFRLFPQVRISADSRSWVHRRYYEKEKALHDRYGHDALRALLAQLPAETQMIVLPLFPVPAASLLSPAEWTLIFENNTASLWLRRTPVNDENFKRVKHYYIRHGIPFEQGSGYSHHAALRAAPSWFERHQEAPAWGRWPRAPQVEAWLGREKMFYYSRGLASNSLE